MQIETLEQAILFAEEILHKAPLPKGRAQVPQYSSFVPHSAISKEGWLVIFNEVLFDMASKVRDDSAFVKRITLTSSKSGVDIPADWDKIIAILTWGWTKINAREALPYIHNGIEATIVWQEGNKLYFGIDNQEVEFLVRIIPQFQSLSDPIPLPHKWRPLMVKYAVVKAINQLGLDPRPLLQEEVKQGLERFYADSDVANEDPIIHNRSFEWRMR